ncbi:hypothetical protein Mapa_001778 [Marchantia paleacea]|nr:hypothetical protein Mapa_001778 [Marchantia paleacea]
MLARNVSGDRLDEELILTLRNGGKRVRVIPLKELRKATNNFSEECQIGGGGFGKMYRGVVNGELVAIKKSELIGTEEAKTQIMNEVEILSGIHHRNRLRGSCFSSKIALLVFEYIPQGTLAEHLHGKTAEALDYLHTAANPPSSTETSNAPTSFWITNSTPKSPTSESPSWWPWRPPMSPLTP